MKVFLDDRRPPPDSSWTLAKTPKEAIALLETGKVEVISFDHDLGLIQADGREQTGNDVLLWIEKQVVVHGMKPPRMEVHSSNPSGRDKLRRGIQSINRAWERAQGEGPS